MNPKKWKLLLIDDEEGIRKVMAIALENAGYEVWTAADGKAGLQICREQTPQLLITDIRMPEMDGIQVLQKVKEEYPDIEVIVVTAFGEMDTAVRALRLNASDYITKPIHDEALMIALDRAKERFKNRKDLHGYMAILEEKWMTTSEELARVFNFQKNLIESSIDGIMGAAENGLIIVYNKSLEKILGYTKEEIIRRFHYERLFPEEEVEKFKQELSSDHYGGTGRLFLYETLLLNKKNEKIPVQLSAVHLFKGKTKTGLVAFIRDLRELRRLEQQFSDQSRLLHQDKMMSLGRLAASVVHEINNPLAGILNYIRLMTKIAKRATPDAETLRKFQRYLEISESETQRCSKIVSGLLDFSRKTIMEFKAFNLNDLMERCILLIRHKLDLQKIRILSDLRPDLPLIMGDFNQFQQCLINLLFNAVDAMPQGGELFLSSAWDMHKGQIEIKVRDTGIGIPKENLPNIFEPFFTTKTEGKGLGLGLAMVYGIVERHRGMIAVNSTPGKGTEFIIQVPKA